MFTKDNNINITINSALKWCRWKNENFCILSKCFGLNDMNSQPQNWQIFMSLLSLFFWTWHYFQRVLFWLHILNRSLNRLHWKVLKKVLKKHRDVSRTIAKAKLELFVGLVSSFQPLTNFTKNPNIGTMGVLNAPLEHFNIFWNLWRWSN